MNFTHIRSKVKMLLTEQKHILQFVILIFFLQYLQFFTFSRCFFLLYLQYLQGLRTFVLFFCCLLSKRHCC